MKNQKKILDFKIAETAQLFLLLTKIEKKVTRANKEFLTMELRDISSSIKANMWDNFEEFFKIAKAGSIVKVDCKFDEYNGTPQLQINRIRLANSTDNVTHSYFLPKSERSLEEMITEWEAILQNITDRYLKQLINKIFDDTVKEKFFNSPAGKMWHHAYIHGLLEHTLEIIKICKTVCSFHPELNEDLIIAGAIFHDFGKIEELTYETNFDYTDKGKLIGHIVISAMLISETANQIEGFPELLKNQLLHLVLSHQGKLEHASPVIPKTPEAAVLYHADELSAKSNAFLLWSKANKQDNSNWTAFARLAETAIYIPPKENN